MEKLGKYFRKNPHLILLFGILLISIFFRTLKFTERFEFSADGDLYSWIVRDIVANKHLRLVGQLTSAPGIFIGPLYYYTLVPFFLLFNMDPIGAIIPIIAIGIITTFSYYFVLSKLFNYRVGLIGAFLQASLLRSINFDRSIVPSTPSNIWSIWYLFAVVQLAKGDFRFLPLLGILIGLIWHIHIALAPALLAAFVAFLFAKKIPNLKEVFLFLFPILILSLPLILFETRHNFLQTRSLINNFTNNFGGQNLNETRTILLGSKNNTGTVNLNESSKFIIDVIPDAPNAGENIRIKVTLKLPKNVTNYVYPDCGTPAEYEIGDTALGFPWSTKGCSNGEHKIRIQAKENKDSFWAKTSDKFLNVIKKEASNVSSLVTFADGASTKVQYFIFLIIFALPLLVWKLKIFNNQQTIIFYTWIAGIIAFFSLSSIVVSEYYLASIDAILISTVAVILSKLYSKGRIGKIITIILLISIAIKSYIYFNSNNLYHKGYIEKKSVIDFITSDAKSKNFPCIGISYITTLGEDVGFRYFFYLKNQHLVHPSLQVPVYNIVIPEELSKEVTKKFGHIGVIPPTNIPAKEVIEKSCQTPNTNLTDSMFGYVQ